MALSISALSRSSAKNIPFKSLSTFSLQSQRGWLSSSSSSPSASFSGSASPSNVTRHWRTPNLPGSLGIAHPIDVQRAQGCWVHTVDGRKYLDFTCGIGVTNLGHCHPKVTKAAIDQLNSGSHLQMNCYTSGPTVRLAEKLASLLPKPLSQIHFSNSGSESVENAIKLARHATKRTNIIVIQGGFHGRTIGAGSLTTAKYVYRAGFQPAMSGVFVTPAAYCYRCPCNNKSNYASAESPIEAICCNEPINQLRLLFKQQTAPDETAAILFEPVLGEGGYVVPPRSFVQALRQIATETGALLIADEVQTGIGRTGSLFAFTQYGIVPDIVVIAKGIANGLPLSCIASSPEIMSRAKPGSIGGTYGGNPVAAAAGVAVLDAIQEENILQNVQVRGKELVSGLNKLKAKGYPIGDIRGLGLMIGVEFNEKAPAGSASKVANAARERGLLLLTAGVNEALRFIAPLIINAEETKQSLSMFENALEDVFGKK